MKILALRTFGDGKRNYSEGDIAEMDPELFEKVNSTPNGILCEALSDDSCEEPIAEEPVEMEFVEDVNEEPAEVAAEIEIEQTKTKAKNSTKKYT